MIVVRIRLESMSMANGESVPCAIVTQPGLV